MKVTRGRLLDQKKIKDKKQIQPATWGLAVALNPERRDIVIQLFLSPGQETGIGGRVVSMGAEAWWVGAGGRGGSLAYKISKAGAWAEKGWRPNQNNSPAPRVWRAPGMGLSACFVACMITFKTLRYESCDACVCTRDLHGPEAEVSIGTA